MANRTPRLNHASVYASIKPAPDSKKTNVKKVKKNSSKK